MAYIGNTPALQYITHAKQTFTADSSTVAFTLSQSVANENELEVFVNNVRQEPGSGKAYTASGTTLTMSAAPNTGDGFYCIYQGKATQTVTPGASTVTNDMLSGSIANAKLANSSITLNSSAVSLGGSHSIANTPYVRAYASGNQNMSNATTTKVEFGGETFDSGNNFSSSRFTPTTSGKYLITVEVNTTYSGSAPNNEYLYLKKNGTTIMSGSVRGAGHGYGFNFVADIVEFNGSSDYVEVFAYGDNTTNYIIEGGTGGYNSNFTALKIIE